MIKEYILQFYKDSSQYDKIINYSFLKRIILFLATVVDENILGLVTGIVTGFSINMFTSFLSFQDGTLCDMLIWIFRLFFAILFMWSTISFAIRSTLIRNKAVKDYSRPRIEREREYRDKLLDAYNSIYSKLRWEILVGIISMMGMSILLIILPLMKGILVLAELVKTFC